MLHTDQIQASTTNTTGLMATPAVPCMLNGLNTKPRLKAVPKTVNVAIGRNTDLTVPCEYWAATDTDHDYGYGYEAIYDPKQVSLVDAEQWVRAQLAEQGVNVDRFINDDNASYLPALTAECERHKLTLQLTDNPDLGLPEIETIDGVRTFLARSDALGIALDELRLGGSCTVYPRLCTSIDGEDGDQTDENGRHFDHGSHAISVPGLEVEGDPEIWAEFTHVSAGTPPHIGFMGFDLTPDQARVKAREMRQFADKLDALADQVATARALHDLRTVRETADPAFARILTIVETAIVRDGADHTEVFDHVLELMDQARAAA